MSQARSLILALLLAFMLPETIAAANPPAVSPESVTWTVVGAFSFEKKPAKTRESLSGIACPPPSESPRRCIAAFDEGIEARYVTVDKGTFVPSETGSYYSPEGRSWMPKAPRATATRST